MITERYINRMYTVIYYGTIVLLLKAIKVATP
jgi:hypothetical protein